MDDIVIRYNQAIADRDKWFNDATNLKLSYDGLSAKLDEARRELAAIRAAVEKLVDKCISELHNPTRHMYNKGLRTAYAILDAELREILATDPAPAPAETDEPALCLCGHDEDYHQTRGGFCRHCGCIEWRPTETESETK